MKGADIEWGGCPESANTRSRRVGRCGIEAACGAGEEHTVWRAEMCDERVGERTGRRAMRPLGARRAQRSAGV